VVCVCGTGRTTPTLVGGRTAAGRCKTGPRPLPQAALNETSSISVIFIYPYCEIHIFNYFSICLLTTPFELLQNHLTRVQRERRDPTHNNRLNTQNRNKRRYIKRLGADEHLKFEVTELNYANANSKVLDDK
jgi:hypothetical protein